MTLEELAERVNVLGLRLAALEDLVKNLPQLRAVYVPPEQAKAGA